MSSEIPPGHSLNGGVRSVAKKLAWPARRFFDPRFTRILQEIEEVKTLQITDATAADETATFTGRSLDTVLAHVEEHARALDALNARLEQLNQRIAFDPDSPHSVDEIDENTARVLNYASGHGGFAARANLWFNPPLLVGYEPQHVELRWVNERIVEVPYAFRALCRVPVDAKVLDVGAAESSVCLSLATLGYDVTAIDPRPNPLSHERLRVVVARVEEWEHDAAFDAVLCLSTIEHIGLPAYGAERKEGADLAAMRRMYELTAPGGLLVLTTRFGKSGADEFQRTYDRAALDRLLEGWAIDELRVVRREDATTWTVADGDIGESVEAVALVTATRSG